MNNKDLKQMNYSGPSMNPTLKVSDTITVVPYGKEEIKCGDVIVFIPPGSNKKIIHRIVSINSESIRTKGDNCRSIDPWILTCENIIGRATHAQRGYREFRILGSKRGSIYAVVISIIKTFNSYISLFLHPFYHGLAKTNFFSKLLLNTKLEPRIVTFNKPDGIEMHILMGNLVIGRKLPGKKNTKWNIHKPFRIFIKDSSLPK